MLSLLTTIYLLESLLTEIKNEKEAYGVSVK